MPSRRRPLARAGPEQRDRQMGELIANGRYGALDLSPLTRRRFADPERWVVEELHI